MTAILDGILAMTDEFRIYCDEILGSSPRMTKKVKTEDDKKVKSGGEIRLREFWNS